MSRWDLISLNSSYLCKCDAQAYEPSMQSQGMSRGDYERLPQQTKSDIAELFAEIKSDLKRYGFSLRFLGVGGHWKDLNAPKVLSLPEDHYRRLIMGSKWVRSTKRRDLVDKISELYKLASKSRLEDCGLESWLT
jgi:hypothetical protein